jgi:uncharacterized protein YqfA (UPF0365 family)
MRVIGWLLGKVSWKTFAAGAATAVVGAPLARPLIVSVVKAGMGATSLVTEAVHQAQVEMSQIQAEAAQQRAAAAAQGGDLQQELQALRAELAEIKSRLPAS